MSKIFTLFFGMLMITAITAQERPEGVFMKVGENLPEIDGKLDDNGAWEGAIVYQIDKPYREEKPTFGEPEETTWRALWSDEGVYIFLSTVDDAWYPSYITGGNSWEYDKPEIYFDVNFVLEDGKGPSASNSGHHQVAPAAEQDKIDGTPVTQDNGVKFAFYVENPNWNVEYFVPWSILKTSEGGLFDKTATLGFDVTMIDRDPDDAARNRADWANIGGKDESWSNCDDVGYVTLDGAEPPIYVDKINLTVDGAITEDKQTLQIGVEILPEDASDKAVKWLVTAADGGRARATVSADGVLSPVIDEEIVVQAVSADGFVFSNEVAVSITGQKPTKFQLSYIKNGDFAVYNEETGAPGAPWTGGSTVVDGVLNITNTNGQGSNPWDWTVGQNLYIPAEIKDEAFELSLKMWIASPDTFDIDIEHIGDDYTRFGSTTHPASADGNSQWRFELTTEPTWHTIDITDFSRMDTREQKFNFFAGHSQSTVYIDSITLVSLADLALIPSSSKDVSVSEETFKVYPNPADTKLNVEFSTANMTVAIYNSVGIKMDEAVVFGTRHVFDVSRYPQGLYFVKADDMVVKFVK